MSTSKDKTCALTPLQEGMLFHEESAPEPIYVVHTTRPSSHDRHRTGAPDAPRIIPAFG